MQRFQDEEAQYGDYYTYDENDMRYKYNDQFMAEYETMDPEKRQAIDEEIKEANELATSFRNVTKELEGGKIQKALKTVSKASKDFGDALQDSEKASTSFEKAIDGLDIDDRLKDPLKKVGKRFGDLIDNSVDLEKEFDSLGVVSDDAVKKLGELGVGEGTQNLIKNTLGSGSGGDGKTSMGEGIGSLFSSMGDIGGMMSGMMNFDMLSMGMQGMNMGMGMFDQMKQMATQAIQFGVQIFQTVVNWWINREDWLYNLLSAIEAEVANFNRQEQVEERFRLYSDEGLNDLVSAWEAMRASLERQIDLNEKLIKAR
jgi:hypothetical protein